MLVEEGAGIWQAGRGGGRVGVMVGGGPRSPKPEGWMVCGLGRSLLTINGLLVTAEMQDAVAG